MHYCDHALSVVNFSHFRLVLRNFNGSKISTPSTMFVFFRADWKIETAVQASDFRLLLYNCWTESTKRKQDLNVHYQVVFLGPIRKLSWPSWLLIGWDIFDVFPETAERNSTKLIGSKISTSSTKFVFLGRSENKDGQTCLWLAEVFSSSFLQPFIGISWNMLWIKI